MPQLQKLEQLSAPHCLLLAVHYAIECNIGALGALTALRAADLDLELVLRLILTYLPESADPSTYVEYLHELASGTRPSGDDDAASLDISPVEHLSGSQARKKKRSLELLPLALALYKNEIELDPFTHFLIHRAHNIDATTGVLELIPQLIVPFLNHSEYLRAWFISTVLPLLRLSYEYYPQTPAPSLEEFARLRGRRAIELQLSNLRQTPKDTPGREHAARDLRGVVGPWMCGANDRKRRKLSTEDRRASVTEKSTQEPDDWECLFEWLVHTSRADLPLVSSVICEWDGPDDMDLGGYEEGRDYVGDETRRKLELRYAQAALACLYLVESSSTETIQTAHALLTRVSELLNFDPPPGLNVSVDSLPSYGLKVSMAQQTSTGALREENIFRPDNALTQPGRDAVDLLQLLLFSVCLFSSLQHPISIREFARMYLGSDFSEQSALLQKIIHSLSSGAKKDDEQWRTIRAKLLWLWNWGTNRSEGDRHAQGIFGNMDNISCEMEILKGLLESSHYQLAIQIYIQTPSSHGPLPLHIVEKVVLATAMHHYDNASNGNRTRGGMKRASDIIAAFSPCFPSSSRFQRMRALLSATHAMSFYSLTLQHGVPFQPVNIRVTADPLSLLRKLLQQNSRSYTHLDDLISIGQNLVVAMPSTLIDDDADTRPVDLAALENKKAAAERRVIGMTVEAALSEDDFETAYSYVVNRLTPPTPSPAASPATSTSSQRFSFGLYDSITEEDDAEDVAWRAALEAGRHHSSPSSSMWSRSGTTARPDLRRLEQRMELLSQALLLAPPRHLEEVLAVWQECEKEMTTLLAEENAAEERFNDAADRRLPGAFTTETVAVQPRREVGRGAVEEAPVGLFDVARGAAAAFSKTAFPLRGSNRTASGAETRDTTSDRGRVSMDLSDSGSTGGSTEERVRKRDMVASAVTGGLASGLGWVLGAKPVADPDRE
ncbi:secretory pathway Sec39 [Trematosphaeria pertusa]|uniref:Secretory pathway Sec39 n=1 Tax=Trematosphaeria pertusa TaxID=390896 RepID=A0A6A6IFI0_9PLEO|nr:secretory pathway Sec39 [Trematosphaeria pertusa]KAF2249166.1 secretory pathway Sec39 [Trematosphaeria pertusa]